MSLNPREEDRTRRMALAAWAGTLLVLLVLTGCRAFVGPTTRTEPSFAELWEMYAHCRSTDEVGALLADARKLTQYATARDRPLPALLQPVRQWISPPVVRVSADPYAMAQACTLRAADAASKVGMRDVALDLYRSILDHARPSRSFYVNEAEAALARAMDESLTGRTDGHGQP